MAVENLYSDAETLANAGRLLDKRSMGGAVLRTWKATVELTAAASATSTYDMFRIPSDLILNEIRFISDDLASTGSPTVDVGLFHADLASGGDDDCLLADVDVASAAVDTTTQLFPDNEPHKEAWDYVASQTTDPHQLLIVRATLKDAAVNTGGTLTIEITGY